METAEGLHVPPAVAADDFVFTVIPPQSLCVKGMLAELHQKINTLSEGFGRMAAF